MNFCKNCGNQLNGSENNCPKCGNVIEKENNVQPTQDNPVSTPEVAPVPAAVTPIAPNPNAAMPTAQVEKPKGNNTTLILVIVLVGLLISGSIVFFALNNKNSSSTKDDDTVVTDKDDDKDDDKDIDDDKDDDKDIDDDDDADTDPISTKDGNKVSYGGYTFELPDGYQSKTDAKLGLIVGDNTVAFSISVDYSHSYDDYLKALKEKYSDQASKMEKYSGTRKYIAINEEDSDGKVVTEYVTKANNNATFVGLAGRADKTAPTVNDFKVLTEILDSTNKKSSFSASDKIDAGENGVVDFTGENDLFSKLK